MNHRDQTRLNAARSLTHAAVEYLEGDYLDIPRALRACETAVEFLRRIQNETSPGVRQHDGAHEPPDTAA
jgi:hypothetical protein